MLWYYVSYCLEPTGLPSRVLRGVLYVEGTAYDLQNLIIWIVGRVKSFCLLSQLFPPVSNVFTVALAVYVSERGIIGSLVGFLVRKHCITAG